jgi:SPP1 family predicted phage head-tail adaptor
VLSRRGASDPGRLRKRVVLEKPTPVPDSAGGSSMSWDAAAMLWAEIVPLRAEERSVGEGPADHVTHRVVIRRREDVAAGDRFRPGERLLRIVGVTDPAEDGRYLVCLTEEEGSA